MALMVLLVFLSLLIMTATPFRHIPLRLREAYERLMGQTRGDRGAAARGDGHDQSYLYERAGSEPKAQEEARPPLRQGPPRGDRRRRGGRGYADDEAYDAPSSATRRGLTTATSPSTTTPTPTNLQPRPCRRACAAPPPRRRPSSRCASASGLAEAAEPATEALDTVAVAGLDAAAPAERQAGPEPCRRCPRSRSAPSSCSSPGTSPTPCRPPSSCRRDRRRRSAPRPTTPSSRP